MKKRRVKLNIRIGGKTLNNAQQRAFMRAYAYGSKQTRLNRIQNLIAENAQALAVLEPAVKLLKQLQAGKETCRVQSEQFSLVVLYLDDFIAEMREEVAQMKRNSKRIAAEK